MPLYCSLAGCRAKNINMLYCIETFIQLRAINFTVGPESRRTNRVTIVPLTMDDRLSKTEPQTEMQTEQLTLLPRNLWDKAMSKDENSFTCAALNFKQVNDNSQKG